MIGILLRCIDKFKRIQTHVEKGSLLVQGEGVDDAIKDVINYMHLINGILTEAERLRVGLVAPELPEVAPKYSWEGESPICVGKDNGFPHEYMDMPKHPGLALYAVFDGNDFANFASDEIWDGYFMMMKNESLPIHDP